MSIYNIENNKLPTIYWELKAPASKRDLAIKRVAVALIALINLSVLGSALYLIIAYCPISTQALLVSPFIVGILGALSYLKFPTFGVNPMNYSQYTNPATILGKGLTYLFFGPYMYAVRKGDWTPYHDPIVAHKIVQDLNAAPFEHLSVEYGPRFTNFAKYGIMPPEYQDRILQLYKTRKPVQKAIEYYKGKGLKEHRCLIALAEKKAEIEQEWETLREELRPHLPYPEIPEHDFSSRFTRCWLNVHDFFLSRPFETSM